MPHISVRLRLFAFALTFFAAGAAQADTGKELFEQRCASCHTIGGGDGGGPDLKGVAAKRAPEWLVRVIAEPEKLTAEKDPTQLALIEKYGFEMPNVGVSREDAAKIVAFLGGGDAPAKEAAPTAAAADVKPAQPAELPVTKELLAKGKDLFTGKERFANGGAPCISCHALNYPGVHGGTLASNLTGLYGRLGENGVRGVLKSLGFPVMKKIYAERPLTDDEISAVTALMKDAEDKKQKGDDPYPLAGLGFFALCLVATLIFKRRIK